MRSLIDWIDFYYYFFLTLSLQNYKLRSPPVLPALLLCSVIDRLSGENGRKSGQRRNHATEIRLEVDDVSEKLLGLTLRAPEHAAAVGLQRDAVQLLKDQIQIWIRTRDLTKHNNEALFELYQLDVLYLLGHPELGKLVLFFCAERNTTYKNTNLQNLKFKC